MRVDLRKRGLSAGGIGNIWSRNRPRVWRHVEADARR